MAGFGPGLGAAAIPAATGAGGGTAGGLGLEGILKILSGLGGLTGGGGQQQGAPGFLPVAQLGRGGGGLARSAPPVQRAIEASQLTPTSRPQLDDRQQIENLLLALSAGRA